MNILKKIGGTPIVEISNYYGNEYANIYVKLEEFNAGGSIKSRVALQMIEDAEENEIIKKGDVLIEATGGNTGIGMAIAAAIKGYKLILVIPDNFSPNKSKCLKEYGAKIIFSNHKLGNNSHILKVEELLLKNPNYINLNQFKNLSNPKAHYLHTGQEIIQTLKKVDYFISVIGSGGTLAGVGEKLKESNKNIEIYGVQPKGCSVLEGKFIPHKIEAIAVGVIPTFIERGMLSGMLDVQYGEIQKIRKSLAKEHGVYVGLSSGANILAAMELAKNKKISKEKIILTIAPDSGRSYIK